MVARSQTFNHETLNTISLVPRPTQTHSSTPFRVGLGTRLKHDMEAFRCISRRSPVICRHGCVACSQPLAAEVGLDILKRGGNAADAAVGVAAALNVTEPCSTGIGGDCFCLFYDSSTKMVRGINGR